MNVLRCAALCCTVLHCAAPCCAVLRCAALCCAVLRCAALCCAVLRCTALCCAVLRVLSRHSCGARPGAGTGSRDREPGRVQDACRVEDALGSGGLSVRATAAGPERSGSLRPYGKPLRYSKCGPRSGPHRRQVPMGSARPRPRARPRARARARPEGSPEWKAELLTGTPAPAAGTLEPELARAAALEHCDLGHNRMTGRIPLALSAKPSLAHFDVGGNDLTWEFVGGG